MKNLHDILNEAVDIIDISNNKKFESFLTEESDFNGSILNEDDDPFANDGGDAPGGDAGSADPFAGDGDMGGGADPFAAGGNDAGPSGPSNNDGNGNNTQDNKESDFENDELDMSDYEDDPEFTQGIQSDNDVTLTDSPAVKSKFDITKLMKVFETVIQSLREEQLAEIELVKKDYELIFNGKILKPEDLDFKNIKNAIFIIRQLGKKMDTKAKAYLYRKLKEPIIKKRDQLKQDIAIQKGDLSNTRDMLTSLDTIDK